jgi:3-oxoadipate enol-lactonase
MEALVEPTVGRWFRTEFVAANPQVVDRIRHMIRTTPVNGFIGGAAALSDFNLRSSLAGIRVPVRFICGGQDAALPGTRALHAGIADSSFVELPGAGHISNLEQPRLFTEALRGFLTA